MPGWDWRLNRDPEAELRRRKINIYQRMRQEDPSLSGKSDEEIEGIVRADYERQKQQEQQRKRQDALSRWHQGQLYNYASSWDPYSGTRKNVPDRSSQEYRLNDYFIKTTWDKIKDLRRQAQEAYMAGDARRYKEIQDELEFQGQRLDKYRTVLGFTENWRALERMHQDQEEERMRESGMMDRPLWERYQVPVRPMLTPEEIWRYEQASPEEKEEIKNRYNQQLDEWRKKAEEIKWIRAAMGLLDPVGQQARPLTPERIAEAANRENAPQTSRLLVKPSRPTRDDVLEQAARRYFLSQDPEEQRAYTRLKMFGYV